MVSTKKAAPGGNGQISLKHGQVTNFFDTINVIPLKSDKSPEISTWSHDYKNPYQVSKSGFYGVVCGPTSDYLQIIDIDCKNDQTGTLFEDYTNLIKEQSDVLERVVIQTTINKGFHIIFKCKKVIGNIKLALSRDNKPLIETRGKGGYFAVHPSPGYEFMEGKDPLALPYISEEDLNILLDTAKVFNAKLEVKKDRIPNEVNITPFDDYNLRGNAFDLLLNHGWNEAGRRINQTLLRRPGKDRGISASWLNTDNLFYVFTTSTEFENDRAYNQSQVYTILEHNGDYSQAAKSLIRAGYGSQEAKNTPKFKNPFRYTTFSEALNEGENLPALKLMVGELIAENQIVIIFGDNGTGKSFAGMHIGDSLAAGKKVLGEFENQTEPHPVIYQDLELTPRQLAKRFSGYAFSPNLIRGSLDLSIDLSGADIGEILINEIQEAAKKYERVTYLIDNISVFDALDLENRREAGKLLSRLNSLKKQYPGLTIILFAHSPKIQGIGPLLKEHLAGSKQLSNLIDCLIGLQKARYKRDIFYIKQLKQRDFSIRYGFDNCISFKIDRVYNSSYVLPIFQGYASEKKLLANPEDMERAEEIKSLREDGLTLKEIGEKFGLSKVRIGQILKSGFTTLLLILSL